MFREFDSAVEKKIIGFFESEIIKKNDLRKVAVFDADGTLWRGDIGEIFFQYQIKNNWIKNLPTPKEKNEGESLWDLYWRYAQSEKAACGYQWLACWNCGLKLEELKGQCADFFKKEWKSKVFPGVLDLTKFLADHGIEVWVVSGSMKWIVAAGAEFLGIPENRVIGSAVVVKQGRLTDEPAHEAPYRDAKARLVDKLIQTKPVFAAGNTYWDKELIETSTGLKLAIHSEHSDEPNFGSEQKLKQLADTNGWLVQKF